MRETVGSESRAGDLTVDNDLVVGSTNVIDELALKSPLASPTFTGTVEAADIEVSGGVFLGGTAAANELDDYEEGTWTPEYAPSSGAFASVTYRSQVGSYQKIGNWVSISFRINTDAISLGTASGNVLITGLPFTVKDNSRAYGGLAVGWSQRFGGEHPDTISPVRNDSRMFAFYRSSSSSQSTSSQVADLNTGANKNDLVCAGIYEAN